MGWTPDADRGRVRLANLDALVELAAQYEDLCRNGQHAASISGLIVWLGELAEEEEDLLAPPAIDAVKVMTHHAAKGLEWPVVVLTDLAAAIKDRLWSITAQSGATLDVQNPLADRSIRYWPWPFGKQKKLAVAEAISKTPMAEVFRKAAVEESKRLLYVSMTRARDLLVLARSERRPTGEWMDSIAAPWLLPEEGGDDILLSPGETLRAMRWELDPADPPAKRSASKVEPTYWFDGYESGEVRLPFNFNPSAAEKCPVTVLEKCSVGDRIPLALGAEMDLLGTAIHACIGLSFTDPNAPLTENEVDNLLKAFGVSGYLSPSSVLRQVRALHDWIETRWPMARPYAEIPVQSLQPSGQCLNGRIDLLLETEAGWILIDHKSSPLAPEHWDQLADEYGMQLSDYGEALERVRGKPVLESWLFLPVAGGAISVGLNKA